MAGAKNHEYHILPPSPWPLLSSMAALVLASGGIMYMHQAVAGGWVFLIVNLIRDYNGAFTPRQHFGFEAAAWYWHFVDVVWLFLFVSIYVWGSWGATVHG